MDIQNWLQSKNISFCNDMKKNKILIYLKSLNIIVITLVNNILLKLNNVINK